MAAKKEKQMAGVSELGLRMKGLGEQLKDAKVARKESLDGRIQALEFLLGEMAEAIALLLKDRIDTAREEIETFDRPVGAEAKKKVEAIIGNGSAVLAESRQVFLPEESSSRVPAVVKA